MTHIMRRFLIPIASIVIVAVSVWMSASDAQACSCGRASPAMLVNNADRVFIARIGETKASAVGYETEIHILHTLKGAVGKKFTWSHPDTNPLCGPSYKPGEVHIVFLHGDHIGLCDGNYGMEAQIGALHAYIKAAKLKPQRVGLKHMTKALGIALKGYTHQRKTIPVLYAPLRRDKITIDGTNLRFRAGKRRRGAIIIDSATQVGSASGSRFSVVSGRYPTEGIRFHILIGGNTSSEILYQSIAEY